MIYVLNWTGYACAGVLTLAGFIKIPVASFPDAAKPALAAVHVCRAQWQEERYDPAQRAKAFARARELGAEATLRRCRGVSCKPVNLIWTTTLDIQDRPEEGP